jgi:release factor glutamine methyltransferase
MAHCLGVTRMRLITDPDQPLTDVERDGFSALIRRRLMHEPVAYITGTKEFWGIDFCVTRDVLIPRPDTERLVEAVLEVLPKKDGGGGWRILDLGTGSGAIAVALAKERPAHRYIAMDRSRAALQIAGVNARRHGVDQNICFFQGDWLTAVAGQRPMFHVVISNPPYIRADEWEALDPDVGAHEPAAALRGGPDGLDAYRRIVAETPSRLMPGGYLFLEMGYRQRRDVEVLAASVGGFEDVRCLTDYAGHDRVLRLRVPSAEARLSTH